MPSTGTPARSASGSTCGAPGSYTLAGPPLRISPAGWRSLSSGHGVVPGTSSQYTFASRTRRAMSWLNWEPKSRTNTVCRRAVFSVTSRLTTAVWLRLLAHAHVLGLLEHLALRGDRRRDHQLDVLELRDVARSTHA